MTASIPQRMRALLLEQYNENVLEAIGGLKVVERPVPARSSVYVYGALSDKACGSIDPIDLLFHDKTVRGFYLGNWIRSRSRLKIFRLARYVQKLLIEGRIETKIQGRLSLDEAVDGLKHYVSHMTEGKALIVP